MIEKKQLKAVLDSITKIIIEQIEDTTTASKATFAGKNLETYNACACGQYIVKGKKQRGIHGSSAAIRVLGGSRKNEYNNILIRLINYLLYRDKIDISDDELSHTNNFQHDNQNIIKLAEQLHSIHFVQPGVANTTQILSQLSKEILDTYDNRNENGWGYFTNCINKDPEILASAFAVMAVSVHGDCSRIMKGIGILSKALTKSYDNEDTITDPATFAILVFTLYVFTFKIHANTRENILPDSELKKIFDKLWNSKFCMLDSHIEQDLDYWNEDDEPFNVRIPWQLHLIAMSAYFDSKKFSSLKVQKLLKSICDNIQSPKKEFKYEYSGNHMSTRTLSILYETFVIIDRNYNSSSLYKIYIFYDKVKIFLGYSWTRRIVYLLIAVLFAYMWWIHTKNFDHLLELLAAESIMAIFIAILEVGKKNHTK